jgi:hypothetical protein
MAHIKGVLKKNIWLRPGWSPEIAKLKNGSKNKIMNYSRLYAYR